MRLEHDDRALIVERIHGIEQRAQLTRMVCIIVVQIRSLKLALKIKAAACALKSGKTVLDGIRADAEHNGCGSGSERVAHIVNTRHVEWSRGQNNFPGDKYQTQTPSRGARCSVHRRPLLHSDRR